MTDDRGYTLTEALVALAIVGLALAGLTQAARLATSHTARAARLHQATDSAAAVQALVSDAPAGLGPFYADEPTFIGDAATARFACRRLAPCALRLIRVKDHLALIGEWDVRPHSIRIDGRGNAHLNYIAQDGSVWASWPVKSADARLAAIAVSDEDRVLALLRFPVENRPGCAARMRTGSCGPAAQDVF